MADSTPKRKAKAPAKPTAEPKAKPAAPRRQSAATPKPRAHRPRRRAAVPMAAALPLDVVEHFGDDRVAMVRAELPPGATERDLYRLLAEAKRLGADPARGDVYLSRGQARDGAATEYSVAAKLDPLLRFVERTPGYAGHDEGAIFETDEFQQGEVIGDGKTLRERAGIRHVSAEPWKRDKLWGAWCAVEVTGRPPTVRVIKADDYIGTAEERALLEPDDPRRRFPEQCAIAAAMAYTLRRAVGLNDLVGADELQAPKFRASAAPAPGPAPAANGDRTAEPLDELDRQVIAEFTRATEHAAGLWPRAKVRARLLACQDDEAREALANEIHNTTSQAITARLIELDRFDAIDLDEEARREYDREVATLRAALEPAAAA
jgi:hypothetical protein